MNAALHITTGCKNKKTVLQQVWCTTPFKVLDITEDKSSSALHLMVMSASPGILDGDVYDIQITAGADSVLHLHTQAYQRLFQMQQGASQSLKVQLAAGAVFAYLPHPSVPHESAHFITRNRFYLHPTSSVVFGEVLTCGRKLNGEAFLFSKYHSLTEIFIADKLVIKENLLMQPACITPHGMGQLEGYTHQASMIWLQPGVDAKLVQAEVLALLATEKNIAFGVSETPVNGVIIRLLGHGAEQLHHCLCAVQKLLPLPHSKPAAHAC